MESIEKISEEWVKDNLCKKCNDPQKSQNKCAVCGFYMMSYNCFYNGCLEMQKRIKLENEKLDESLIGETKQNIECQEIIDNLKKEHEEQNEILNQIKNICELALNRTEKWSKEQLEELIKQIKKRMD